MYSGNFFKILKDYKHYEFPENRLETNAFDIPFSNLNRQIMKNDDHQPAKCKITRRHFVSQSAMAGGSVFISGMIPKSMISSTKISDSMGMVNKELLSRGWLIRSIDPVESLSDSLLAECAAATQYPEWLKISLMPAMPHGILLEHQKIGEPWKPFGTEKCYWVSKKDWIYSVNFPAENPSGKYRLLFREVKGSMIVYLNGSKIAGHSDQSHPLIVDVTGKLKDVNNLVLHFEKAEPAVRPGAPDPSKRAPKATYFGFNPLMHTSGVVGDVFLEHTDGIHINEIITDFSVDNEYKEGKVKFNITGKSRTDRIKLQINLFDPDGKMFTESTSKPDVNNGIFNSELQVKVADPKLWWPRGYGDQNLYKAEITLIANGKDHQREYRTIGFRRITMPEELHFEVNGKPVFLRGGNWVTPDMFSDVWNPERVEKLMDMAENANFNAFRIWGVVEAPNDNFYEMADERGFLLWQDFTQMPFRNDRESITISKEKARKFLVRLKHHPCILMWCGINEAAMWWHEDYNNSFTDRGLWPGLEAAKAVEDICHELDPDRYFIPSAPYGGENANDPKEGSTNGYTNMWFVPGYDYLNFASEDTRIAAPPLHSMEKFMLPEEIFPDGYTTLAVHGNQYPFPSSWLPYTTAESWKKTGPVEQFYDAADPASLVNRIGMAEGVYYKEVIERQRRGRPAAEDSERRCCGGYLVWKYNDSWPEIYSAKVDYFLEPYHAYYTLKAAYAPVMLSFDFDSYIYLWAINDSINEVQGTVKIQLYHLQECEFRKEIIRDVSLAPGKSVVVVRLDEAGIRAFRKEHILFAEWKDNAGNIIARTNALADIERRCIFPDAKLEILAEGKTLNITTDKFARNINLEGNADGDRSGWFFEDNYFDLFPGEVKEVKILGHHEKGIIKAKPWYSKFETNIDWEYRG